LEYTVPFQKNQCKKVDTSWEQTRCQIQIDSINIEIVELNQKHDMSTSNIIQDQGRINANIVNHKRQRDEMQQSYDTQFKLVQDRRKEVRRLTYTVGGLSPDNQEKLAQTLRFLVNGVSQFSFNLNSIKGYADKFLNMLKQSCSDSPGTIQMLDFAKVVAKAASIGDLLQTNSVHFLIDEDTRQIAKAQLSFLNKVATSPLLHNAPAEVKEIMVTTKQEYSLDERPLW